MATPAISGNMLIVRTQTQLVGIGSVVKVQRHHSLARLVCS